MDKKIKDFLADIKEKKVEQMMGIELDLNYWKKVVGNDDEDVLRKDLEEENNKRIANKNGSILKDERDMDKIQNLNKRINTIAKAREESGKLVDMKQAIQLYIDHINNPSKETLSALEVASKL